MLSKFVLHIYFPMMPVKHGWRCSLIRKKERNAVSLGQKKLIASFSGTAACVFLLPHWSFLHWGENKNWCPFPVISGL